MQIPFIVNRKNRGRHLIGLLFVAVLLPVFILNAHKHAIDEAFRDHCISLDGSADLSIALSLDGHCTTYNHDGIISPQPCSSSIIQRQNHYYAACSSRAILCLEAYNRALPDPSDWVYNHDALVVRQRATGSGWICRLTPLGSSIQSHALWINGDWD